MGCCWLFISCLDNFGTVAFLGIPARITVLSTDIYQAIISFSGNSFGEAAAESVILGVIGVLSSLILWQVAKMFQTMQNGPGGHVASVFSCGVKSCWWRA